MDATGASLLSLLMLGFPLAALSAAPETVTARIRARLAGFKGVMGVAAKDLNTGEEVLVDADRRFPTASVIKVAVMLEVFHQIAEGKLQRDREVELPEAAKVGGSGVLFHLRAGLRPTVMDLVDLMISVSDNTATNLLVDLVETIASTRASRRTGSTTRFCSARPSATVAPTSTRSWKRSSAWACRRRATWRGSWRGSLGARP